MEVRPPSSVLPPPGDQSRRWRHSVAEVARRGHKSWWCTRKRMVLCTGAAAGHKPAREGRVDEEQLPKAVGRVPTPSHAPTQAWERIRRSAQPTHAPTCTGSTWRAPTVSPARMRWHYSFLASCGARTGGKACSAMRLHCPCPVCHSRCWTLSRKPMAGRVVGYSLNTWPRCCMHIFDDSMISAQLSRFAVVTEVTRCVRCCRLPSTPSWATFARPEQHGYQYNEAIAPRHPVVAAQDASRSGQFAHSQTTQWRTCQTRSAGPHAIRQANTFPRVRHVFYQRRCTQHWPRRQGRCCQCSLWRRAAGCCHGRRTVAGRWWW